MSAPLTPFDWGAAVRAVATPVVVRGGHSPLPDEMPAPAVIEPWTIAKLDVQAGDVLVVQAPGKVSAAAAEFIGNRIGALVPGVEVLILDGGATAAILRQEPI